VEYNETTDKATRAVVDGETTPDVTFEDADPPTGGLRTWPQIRHIPPNKPENIRKLTNLKVGLQKGTKTHQQNGNKQGHLRETPSGSKGHGNILKHTSILTISIQIQTRRI
jgi:hypothetical protein